MSVRVTHRRWIVWAGALLALALFGVVSKSLVMSHHSYPDASHTLRSPPSPAAPPSSVETQASGKDEPADLSGESPSEQLPREPEEPIRLELAPGGARVAGQVLDATGGAIGGAWISADERENEFAGERSDAEGHFELSLAPGPSVLRVRAEGYAQLTRRVWAPSSSVSLSLVPAAALRGRVVAGGSAEPVADVVVHAVNTNGMHAAATFAMSAADGGFALEGLSPGEYSLGAANARWRSVEQIVQIGVAELGPEVLVEVAAATSLTARVLIAGEPCQEGWVSLSGPVSSTSAVAANGAVSFEGLPPGRYNADVRCPPGAPIAEPLQVGLEALHRTWQLAPGASVRGTVETRTGERLPGVEVVVAPGPDAPQRSGARCVTNSAGEFTCTGLLAGEHDCWPARAGALPPAPTRVTLSEGETAWLTLQAHESASLRARLLGTPSDWLATSLVARRSGAPPELARLTADGFLFSELELGEYELAFEPTLRPVARVTLAHPGETLEVNLPAPQRASIGGWVRDEHGVAVVDAWVRAQPAHAEAAIPPASAPVLTDENGSFTIGQLVLGPHDLEVSAPSGRTTLEGVEAGTRGVLVSLPTRATLSVHVFTLGGDPVQRFTVTFGEQGSPAGEKQEGHAGIWSSQIAQPGKLSLRVTSNQGEAAEDLDVTPGAQLEATLRVTAGESDSAQSAED